MFQTVGAATLKLRAPNDVRTNGAETRLVLGGEEVLGFLEFEDVFLSGSK